MLLLDNDAMNIDKVLSTIAATQGAVNKRYLEDSRTFEFQHCPSLAICNFGQFL